MPPGSGNWPSQVREQLTGTLKPAGVLIPIVDRAVLSVLLTQRSAELKHHGGQISFPGGRMEDFDANIEATALRETQEEIGIATGHIDVVGYLTTMPTITGYAVTPVVGMVSTEIELRVDKTEVDYAFEVPLTYLLDGQNDVRVERKVQGRRVTMTEIHWEDQRIWGATAFMIMELRERLLK